jgi:hypothetical protein
MVKVGHYSPCAMELITILNHCHAFGGCLRGCRFNAHWNWLSTTHLANYSGQIPPAIFLTSHILRAALRVETRPLAKKQLQIAFANPYCGRIQMSSSTSTEDI